MQEIKIFQIIGQWLNENQGVLALILFFTPVLGLTARWFFRRKLLLKSLQPTISIENDRSLSGYNDNYDDPELTMSYKLIDQNKIIYTLPYLEKINNRNRIKSNFYFNTPFNLSFPTLILDLLNDGDSPILVKGFRFKVKASKAIKIPIPIFRPIGAPFEIYLVNEGSAPMRKVKVVFYVSTTEDPEMREMPYSCDCEEINSGIVINISSQLEQEGVDVDYLSNQAGQDRLASKMAYICAKDETDRMKIRSDYDTKIAKALGPYRNLPGFLLFVHGKLIYEYDEKKYSIPFTTHTWILSKPHAPPPLEATFDIEFKEEGSNYSISKNDIHLLGAKEGNRFKFNLSAKSWSKHLFDVEMITNKGTKNITRSMTFDFFSSKMKPIKNHNQQQV